MAIRASYFSYGEVLFVLELHVHLFIPQPEIIFNPSSLCHLEIGCPQLLAKLFLNRSFHPACGNPLLNLLDDAFFRPSPVLLDLWMLFFFFFQRWVRRKMFERWQGQLPTILYDFLFVGHIVCYPFPVARRPQYHQRPIVIVIVPAGFWRWKLQGGAVKTVGSAVLT